MEQTAPHDDISQPYETSRYGSLVLNLGRALLHVGSPAHRLESAMQIMAKRLGLQAEFFSTPTALMVTLGDGNKQQTYLARSEPGAPNLSKLADLTEVMEQLAQREIDPDAADERVREIDTAPPRFNMGWQFIAFVAIACGVTPLLGGGWRETALATVLGLITATSVLLLGSHAERARLIAPLAATLTTFLGTIWCGFDAQTALMPALIASIIALIPGMDLTTACRELATGHLVSGASRMASAAMMFALITFGLVVGGLAGQAVVGPVGLVNPDPLPQWVTVMGLLIAAFGLVVLFQGNRRDWIWMLLAALIAWSTSFIGVALSAPVIGAFAGALLIGLSGNVFVRYTGRPGSIIHIPGLILLVPGSIGLRSLATLLDHDVISGIETALLTAMIAVALTTGMIVSSALVPPRKNTL
ncbi:MAG: threonine/serine exporter family protein [Pseudomonadota bacterium]